MLTVKAAAKIVGVSASLIYEWCHAGRIVHFRFPGRGSKRGRIAIDEADLKTFLATCRKAGEPEQRIDCLRHITLP
jgi:excisionase family DNA binding protein